MGGGRGVAVSISDGEVSALTSSIIPPQTSPPHFSCALLPALLSTHIL